MEEAAVVDERSAVVQVRYVWGRAGGGHARQRRGERQGLRNGSAQPGRLLPRRCRGRLLPSVPSDAGVASAFQGGKRLQLLSGGCVGRLKHVHVRVGSSSLR
jgi:hypothetical protein